MRYEIIRNDTVGEQYYTLLHESGLRIIVMPKPGYASAYAVFSVKYGSIDIKAQSEDGSFVPIPDGTAHFLEHKLFESEEVAAFDRFAQTGAYANAYTGFDRTAYLFSCSTNFAENLEILLDFVRKPYFTEETVQKEQGIIGQEIRMYRDIPDWEVMFNLLRALYKNCPVKTDIAGTQESIAGITAELLYKCYHHFYSLSNMVLSVAGNVDPEEVLAIADRLLPISPSKPVMRENIAEPAETVTDSAEEKLPINVPQFLLGYKEYITSPEKSASERVAVRLLLDILAGKASPLFKRLVNEGLVNTGFGSEHLCGFGYSCVMLGGESNDPERAAGYIKEEIARLKAEGINPRDFERAKKKLYGRLVMQYNDVDNIANGIVDAHFAGCGIFDELQACRDAVLDDVTQAMNSVFVDSRCALSVILPMD